MSELVVLLPILLVVFLALVDMGRLVYDSQVLADVARESANLVSRGMTPEGTFQAAARSANSIDVINRGGMIISEIRRRGLNDPTPWIFNQYRRGPLSAYPSKVGTVNGPANIPDVNALNPGLTLYAVETVHPFEPVFALAGLGLAIYPEVIYDVAFF